MRLLSPARVLAVLALCAFPPPAALAQPPLGDVVDVQVGPAFCGPGPLTLARPYTCIEATVACPDINPRLVNLRVTEPPDEVSLRGTVVMGMGGAGTGWYELVSAFARDLLDDLNAEGFRVVQRRWGADPTDPGLGGWFSGSLSLHHSACRYATLLDWIYADSGLHEPGVDAFCATGNSGGSSEISYALSVYGMGALLDLALPTAGPPHGVVDRGCGVDAAAWEPLCNELVDARGICPAQQGDHACFYSPGTAAAFIDGAFDLTGTTPCADLDGPVLRANGVVFPGAVFDYPQTRVHFLIGEDDCGSAPPLGLPYIQRVLSLSTGPRAFHVIPGAPHTMPATAAGAQAIHGAIASAQGCVLRHPPG
jgi:hypothetical protein